MAYPIDKSSESYRALSGLAESVLKGQLGTYLCHRGRIDAVAKHGANPGYRQNQLVCISQLIQAIREMRQLHPELAAEASALLLRRKASLDRMAAQGRRKRDLGGTHDGKAFVRAAFGR
jgi:hypothetical protein